MSPCADFVLYFVDVTSSATSPASVSPGQRVDCGPNWTAQLVGYGIGLMRTSMTDWHSGVVASGSAPFDCVSSRPRVVYWRSSHASLDYLRSGLCYSDGHCLFTGDRNWFLVRLPSLPFSRPPDRLGFDHPPDYCCFFGWMFDDEHSSSHSDDWLLAYLLSFLVLSLIFFLIANLKLLGFLGRPIHLGNRGEPR